MEKALFIISIFCDLDEICKRYGENIFVKNTYPVNFIPEISLQEALTINTVGRIWKIEDKEKLFDYFQNEWRGWFPNLKNKSLWMEQTTYLEPLQEDLYRIIFGIDEEQEIGFPEGRIYYVLHKIRERNPQLVQDAKLSILARKGSLNCEICNFNFEEKYGNLGKGYIECHHLIPINMIDENYSTKLQDVILVCTNCHRMLHRKRPWPNKNEIYIIFNVNN